MPDIPDTSNVTSIEGLTIAQLEYSGWYCHLFGSTGDNGFTYRPLKDNVPNRFVRWMMKLCFACTWVNNEGETK